MLSTTRETDSKDFDKSKGRRWEKWVGKWVSIPPHPGLSPDGPLGTRSEPGDVPSDPDVLWSGRARVDGSEVLSCKVPRWLFATVHRPREGRPSGPEPPAAATDTSDTLGPAQRLGETRSRGGPIGPPIKSQERGMGRGL